MSNTNLTERESKSASRAMTEWLEQQYDASPAMAVHSGPDALAWDDHGLQVAGQSAVTAVLA